MTARSPWLVLAIVSSALFLIVIDMTVLYTALPTLTRDLEASATEKLWIVNAYSLVVAGLLPGAERHRHPDHQGDRGCLSRRLRGFGKPGGGAVGGLWRGRHRQDAG